MTRPSPAGPPNRLAGVLRVLVPAVVLAAFAPSAAGQEARPSKAAGELLRLVPADAGAVLLLEDLRGHAREIGASGVLDRLRQTPAFRRWREDGGFRALERSVADLETLLGTSWRTVRDDLLGDGVLLSLHLRPGESPDRSRGLLIARPRDPGLLGRLIDSLNQLERASGALSSLDERQRGEVPYTARVFGDPARPADYYAALPDGTFFWTSDEALLLAALDREAGKGGAGLVDQEGYRRVAPTLPDRGLIRLFVEPTFVRAMASADPSSPRLADLPGPVRGAIERMKYVGLALEWRGDLVLHEVDWSGPEEGGAGAGLAASDWLSQALARVPMRPIALASAVTELGGLYDVALDVLSEKAPRQRERLEIAFRGLLMDRDPRVELVSRLGPGVIAYAMPPGPGESRLLPPMVVAVGLKGDEGLGRSLENALRTVAAFSAIDAAKRKQDWRIRAEGGLTIVERVDQDGGPRLAFGSTADWFVVGTSPDLVSTFLSAPADSAGPGPLFAEVRETYLEGVPAFAFVDLLGLARSLRDREDDLARSLALRRGDGGQEDQARADLAQLISLLELGRAAFYTDRAGPGSLRHRSLGVVFSPSAGGKPSVDEHQ